MDIKTTSPATDVIPSSFRTKGACWRRSGKCLGRGSFGEVWLGLGEDGELVALKTVTWIGACLKSIPLHGHHNSVDDIVREVELLCKLQHDNIVAYVASSVVCAAGGGACFVVVVMESATARQRREPPCDAAAVRRPAPQLRPPLHGSSERIAFSLRKRVEGMSEIASTSSSGTVLQRDALYTRDVVKGLCYLHSQGVMHRDLKPANVLLQPDGMCRLADFGASATPALGKGVRLAVTKW
eukprot:gene57333-biopygen28116